jgi:hypothetical protein
MTKKSIANQMAREDIKYRKAQHMSLATMLNNDHASAECEDVPNGKFTWTSFYDGQAIPQPEYVKSAYVDEHPEGQDRGGYVVWVDGNNGGSAYYYDGEWRDQVRYKQAARELAVVQELETADGLPQFIFSDGAVLTSAEGRDAECSLKLPSGDLILIPASPPPPMGTEKYINLLDGFYT